MTKTTPRVRRRLLAAVASVLLAVCAVLGALVARVTQPMLQAPAQTPAVSASPARLERDVRAIVEDFGPRGHEQPASLDAVADYIAAELQAAGARVERQRYDGVAEVRGDPEGTYVNIVARFGPAPSTAEGGPGVIVVGAHYDAFDGLPGADDNASGTAGLLELARLLDDGPPLTRPVELVAYSTEEPPHFRTARMGSAVHLERALDAGTSIRAMICLEMIGRFHDEPDSQRYPVRGLGLLYPRRGDFVALVGRWGDGPRVRDMKRAFMSATAVPVRSINAPPQLQGIDFSDHLNYWAEDIPAVMVTDTAFFRHGDYHTPRDTPDRLDYERMAGVVDGVHAMLRALDSTP